MIIVVQKEDSGILGLIRSPNLSWLDILNLWADFKTAIPQPDSDSEFIDWLCKNHGCQEVENWTFANIQD